MAEAYLTPEEAHIRLAAYGIDALPEEGPLIAASRRLNQAGPFKGARYEPDQPRAFPRTFKLEEDTEGEVPEAVLDWVALQAHELTSSGASGGGGHKPPVSSISHSAAGSVTYASPKIATEQWLRMGSITPYQRQTGTIR